MLDNNKLDIFQFSKSDIYSCGYLLRKIEDDCDLLKIYPLLWYVANECNNYKGNDFVEVIFRRYILNGDFGFVKKNLPSHKCSFSQPRDMVEIIVYRQSSDKYINLLAKSIYKKSGRKNITGIDFDFLDWQLKKLFNNQEIEDIEKEYEEFKIVRNKEREEECKSQGNIWYGEDYKYREL